MIILSGYNQINMQKSTGIILLFVCIAVILVAGCTSQAAPPATVTTEAAHPIVSSVPAPYTGLWITAMNGDYYALSFREGGRILVVDSKYNTADTGIYTITDKGVVYSLKSGEQGIYLYSVDKNGREWISSSSSGIEWRKQ